MEVMVGFPILVPVDPFESTIGKQTLDEHGVVHFPLITKRYIRAKKARDGFGAVDVHVAKCFVPYFE